MKTLKFDPQFKPLILTNQKRQTVRRGKVTDYQIGELIYMESEGLPFWAVNIRTLTPVIIDPENQSLYINGVERPDRDTFAKRDGFKTFSELCDYIGEKYGYELFHGVGIGW